MAESRTGGATHSSVAPGAALPAESGQRHRLLQKAELAAAWVGELVRSLEDHVTQVIARHNLQYRIGATEAARLNAARQPVMDALTRRIAELIVDQRHRIVKEVEEYLDPLPGGCDSLDELLFRYVPNNDYAVDTLARATGLAATLLRDYQTPLLRLCSRLSSEPAPAPSQEPVPDVLIQVGDDPYRVREPKESFIEYGLTGSLLRKRISLSFQTAAILKILKEAPHPGLVSTVQLKAEARTRGWRIGDVRWNRVRPVLEKELTSDLKGLVGKGTDGQAFFDQKALAGACHKLAT